MAEVYDVVVIGGGPVGENVAWYARHNGLSVALAERQYLGGQCSFFAGMPSKAMLRPGDALAAARRVAGAAVAIAGNVDAAATLRTRDGFLGDFDDGPQAEWLESLGATLIRGEARLTGPRAVTVETPGGPVDLQADKAVVLATGTSAAIPDIEGLDRIAYWDNRDATTTSVIPERLLVLGGGMVGVELAQAFHRLGAREVTIVEAAAQLLRDEEPAAGAMLRDALESEGIAVLTDVTVARADRDGTTGPVTLTLADGQVLVGDELLVATGREPNVMDVGLDHVGLATTDFVAVDDALRVQGVEGDWLYAVGDVNGRTLVTHHGKYQARVCADVIAGKNMRASSDHGVVVRVAFTDPQVAAVGLTEQQARDARFEVKVVSVPWSSVAATALMGSDITGLAHLVIDNERRTILGATFVGPTASGLLHPATVAMVGGLTLEQLWHAVPASLTLSELWLRLLEADRGV